jgi:hypothetical protein
MKRLLSYSLLAALTFSLKLNNDMGDPNIVDIIPVDVVVGPGPEENPCVLEDTLFKFTTGNGYTLYRGEDCLNRGYWFLLDENYCFSGDQLWPFDG